MLPDPQLTQSDLIELIFAIHCVEYLTPPSRVANNQICLIESLLHMYPAGPARNN